VERTTPISFVLSPSKTFIQVGCATTNCIRLFPLHPSRQQTRLALMLMS
jgi:hypothetical protein